MSDTQWVTEGEEQWWTPQVTFTAGLVIWVEVNE